MRRHDFKRVLPFSERLSQFAQRGREQAQAMRPSKNRDDILQKVRQTEVALQVDEWLSLSAAVPK